MIEFFDSIKKSVPVFRGPVYGSYSEGESINLEALILSRIISEKVVCLYSFFESYDFRKTRSKEGFIYDIIDTYIKRDNFDSLLDHTEAPRIRKFMNLR